MSYTLVMMMLMVVEPHGNFDLALHPIMNTQNISCQAYQLLVVFTSIS